MNPIKKTITYLTVGLTLLVSPIDSFSKNYEKEAYKTFKKIINIRQNQTTSEQKRAARVYILKLADEIGNKNKHASPKEIKKALIELENVEGKIADQYFGDKDGIPEIWEINNMNSSIQTYPGLETLIEMKESCN